MIKRSAPAGRPFLTRLDISIILVALVILATVGVVVKYVLQKDTYVNVELLASGGEWWWGVPPPYYWNTRDVAVGAKEYDALKKPIVEIADVVKYGEDDRKFMWMKVRLRVKRNYLTREYVFKQESLQIGKSLHIAPNNISLIGLVVGIDGVGRMWDTEYVTLTGKVLKIQQWESAAIVPGDTVTDNKGDIVAQVLSVHAEQSDIVTTTWQGEPLRRKDPLLQDVTVKMKVRVMKDGERRFFNFYQPVGIGNKIRIQFPKTAYEINIMEIGKSD